MIPIMPKNSNMPRLPWQRSKYETGAFVAYPNGEENGDQFAWVGPWQMTRPKDGACWPYGISWKGRFHFISNGTSSKQGSADAATEAWWLHLEKTEGWVKPPPPPPPPPPDPHLVMLAEHRRHRIAEMMTMELWDLSDHYYAYRDAASGAGPSIEGDRELDRESWEAAQGAFVKRFGHIDPDFHFMDVRLMVLNVGGKTLDIGSRARLDVVVHSFHPVDGWVNYSVPGWAPTRGPVELFVGQKLVQEGKYSLVGVVTGIERNPDWGMAVTLDGVGPLLMPVSWRAIRAVEE